MEKAFRVIAIGASSGGRNAIAKVLETVPDTVNAAILVVVHGAFDMPSFYDIVLSRITDLRVVQTEHGMLLERGTVYIAQPNKHLFVSGDRIYLSKGPRENLFRPAIDVLFRSVAVTYGNRSVGLLMSGRLNDGTTGLEAIKKCGGIAMIQDPASAEYAAMPANAQQYVAIDYSLNLEEISGILQQLVKDPLPPEQKIPRYLIRENEIVNQIGSNISKEEKLGHQVPISCPSCSGPLWELENTSIKRYRCHVGHSFTEEALLRSQNEALEEAFWVSLRTLEEKKMLLERMSKNYSSGKKNSLSRSYDDKIDEISQHILKLRQILQLDD